MNTKKGSYSFRSWMCSDKFRALFNFPVDSAGLVVLHNNCPNRTLTEHLSTFKKKLPQNKGKKLKYKQVLKGEFGIYICVNDEVVPFELLIQDLQNNHADN